MAEPDVAKLMKNIRKCCTGIIAVFTILFIFTVMFSPEPSGLDRRREKQKQKTFLNEDRMKREEEEDRRQELRSMYPSETRVLNKRYKLFEKEQIDYQKAIKACKKHGKNGRLAVAENIEEMRRLQMLLMRAVKISHNIWLGIEKKEWKRHSEKAYVHPALSKAAIEQMEAAQMNMLGGSRTMFMCPSLSISTRSLQPVECTKQLPYICEFDIERKNEKTTGRSLNSNKKEAKKTKLWIPDENLKYPHRRKTELR